MTRLDGPDISHYQYTQDGVGDPDWGACRDGGCWWGATKLTQSTGYLDPTADRSRRGMRAAGFTHVGLYHWLSATTDPKQQAAWFLSNLGELAPGEFVMLDDEEAGVTVAKTLAWLEAVEARTRRPCAVYSGAYVAGGTIWQSTAVRTSRYGPRPMILAAYTTEAKAKALPGVGAYSWSAWQFSSNGPVPGITGRCDMNRVDDRAAFDWAAGLSHDATTIEAQPTPTPQTEDDDMRAFTHSEPLDGNPPGHTFWVLMPDGTKRHINGVELDVILRQRDGAPALDAGQLAQIPDWTPPATAGAASQPLAYTIQFSGAGTAQA